METELLPCPCCGGKATIEQNCRNGYKLKCTSCLVMLIQKTKRLGMDWLKEKMIETWNKRTPNSMLQSNT